MCHYVNKRRSAFQYNDPLNNVFLLRNDKAAVKHSIIRIGLSVLKDKRHSYDFIHIVWGYRAIFPCLSILYFLMYLAFPVMPSRHAQDIGPLVNYSISRASTEAQINILMFGINNEPTDKFVVTFEQNYIWESSHSD